MEDSIHSVWEAVNPTGCVMSVESDPPPQPRSAATPDGRRSRAAPGRKPSSAAGGAAGWRKHGDSMGWRGEDMEKKRRHSCSARSLRQRAAVIDDAMGPYGRPDAGARGRADARARGYGIDDACAWWGSRDSNPDARRHVILSHARLPVSALPHDGGASRPLTRAVRPGRRGSGSTPASRAPRGGGSSDRAACRAAPAGASAAPRATRGCRPATARCRCLPRSR